MADNDQDPEVNEPGKVEKGQQTSAPKKKAAAKKKVAKKVAKKKVTTATTTKKKVAKKAAKSTASRGKTTAALKGHEEIQSRLEQMEVSKVKEPSAAARENVEEPEVENQTVIGLWVVIAVVSLIFISALSPSQPDKPKKALEQAAPEGHAATQQATPSEQQGSTLFRNMIPEKYIFGKKSPEAAPEAGLMPPERPQDSPPGYWVYESEGAAAAWRYVPFEQEAPTPRTQAPAAGSASPDQGAPAHPAAPAEQPVQQGGSALFQHMIPEKFIFGGKSSSTEKHQDPTAADQRAQAAPKAMPQPPKRAEDSPPGYWLYVPQGSAASAESPAGVWRYIPYGSEIVL